MSIRDIKVGDEFNHPTKGNCVVLKAKGKRITIAFEHSKSTNVYDKYDALFNITDY